MSIAGIDVGTTGCKCSVYSQDGQLQEEAYREYPSVIDGETHEIDPLVVWERIKEVVKEVADKVENIDVIGVTSFGEAFVLLDDEDKPLMNSMLYTDTRGKDECQELVEEVGKLYLNKNTGLNPDAMYSLPKLMWIKKHKPSLLEGCARICLYEDYVVYMLSGVQQIDYSLATRTMAFNINTLEWDESILHVAGIQPGLLSKVVPIGTMAGSLRGSLVDELGLATTTKIVSGCHDQIAAAIGTGVYKKGMAVDGTGTVECITNIFDGKAEGVNYSQLYSGSYAVVPFLEDLSVAYAFSFTGGALLRWYRDQLASEAAKIARDKGLNDYDSFNKQIDMTQPSGLLALPYFAGAGTPNMDGEAKGALLGLTLETTSIDIYKALMEGVTYEMRLNIERLSQAGIEIDVIRATGGGATSKEWLQIKADILKKPVVSLGAAQSGTVGSIMLAGLAIGVYKTMSEAEESMVTVKDIYYPRKDIAEAYDSHYSNYKQIYNSIKHIR